MYNFPLMVMIIYVYSKSKIYYLNDVRNFYEEKSVFVHSNSFLSNSESKFKWKVWVQKQNYQYRGSLSHCLSFCSDFSFLLVSFLGVHTLWPHWRNYLFIIRGFTSILDPIWYFDHIIEGVSVICRRKTFFQNYNRLFGRRWAPSVENGQRSSSHV